MAKKKDHLTQAAHNEALAEYIATNPYPDWIATLKFYAALHFVQSYFLSLNPPQNPQSHSQRAIAIDNDTFLDPIRDDYRDLQDVSQACRYACWKPDTGELKLVTNTSRTSRNICGSISFDGERRGFPPYENRVGSGTYIWV